LTEGYNLVDLKAFGSEINEMILVAKEYLALDTPMVVDEVGIEKVHAPALALWREATQEQQPCILWQKRT
jgi:hypothetical protein